MAIQISLGGLPTRFDFFPDPGGSGGLRPPSYPRTVVRRGKKKKFLNFFLPPGSNVENLSTAVSIIVISRKFIVISRYFSEFHGIFTEFHGIFNWYFPDDGNFPTLEPGGR